MSNNSSSNTLVIVNFVLLLVILLLGLTGKFGSAAGGALTKSDVEALVKANPPAAAPAPAAAPTPTPAPPAGPTKVAKADYDAFLKTATVDGKEDAKVTVIEFSDVECPYCKRHVTNGTLDSVKEKYGEDVNIIFAHFPLNFHPNAQKAGEAIECAKEAGNESTYFTFKKAIFSDTGKPTVEALKRIAGETSGIDSAKFDTCLDDGTYEQLVKDQMAFGRKLGVTGTPGNIVVNNDTLDITKVSGAVPAASFDAVIDGIIN